MLYYMIGQVAAVYYNMNKKKSASPKSGWDFVPFSKLKATEQSPKSMKQLLLGLVKGSGKKKAKKEIEKNG